MEMKGNDKNSLFRCCVYSLKFHNDFTGFVILMFMLECKIEREGALYCVTKITIIEKDCKPRK